MAMNGNSFADLPILQTSETPTSIVLNLYQDTNDQSPFEFDRLPMEIAVEIMSLMPVETLKQLKLVNKSKHSLITGLLNKSEFVAKHLQIHCHSRANASASFLHVCHAVVPQLTLLGGQGDILEEHRLESFPIDKKDMPYDVKVGHCDGIVILFNKRNFALCNPALREFSVLHLPSGFDISFRFVSWVEEIGFGYDAISEKYKVVRILRVCQRLEQKRKAEVWTLGTTDLWREIEISVPDWGFACLGSPVYFQGVCFWLMNDKKVLSFEMSSEVFRSVDLPDYCDGEIILKPHLRLAMRSGSVCLLCYDGRVREVANFVRIWVMEIERSDYGWRELPSIELVPGILMSPLMFSKEDELVVSTEEVTGCYNVVTGELRTIPLFCDQSSRLRFNTYVPSLVSVKRLIKKSKC